MIFDFTLAFSEPHYDRSIGAVFERSLIATIPACLIAFWVVRSRFISDKVRAKKLFGLAFQTVEMMRRMICQLGSEDPDRAVIEAYLEQRITIQASTSKTRL